LVKALRMVPVQYPFPLYAIPRIINYTEIYNTLNEWSFEFLRFIIP
jgi:hypothetical protein